MAQDSCGAAEYQDLTGASLAAIRLPRIPNARYIAPETVVTKDYDPERVNIYIDEDRVIARIICG